jgi:hypothetical protein
MKLMAEEELLYDAPRGYKPIRAEVEPFKISAQFNALAVLVSEVLPEGPEKTRCVLKLAESQDAAVRAALQLKSRGLTYNE